MALDARSGEEPWPGITYASSGPWFSWSCSVGSSALRALRLLVPGRSRRTPCSDARPFKDSPPWTLATKRCVRASPSRSVPKPPTRRASNSASSGDAVKAYWAAIRLKPDYGAAYTNLGFSLSRLERWQEACFAYENAIRLTPDDVDAHYNLGVALVMLGRPGAALREFRETVELVPMDADAHYNMGLALNSLGRHAEAVQAYREAVRVRPDYADAWGNLGLTANVIGRYRESADAFERAKALLPAYFDSRPRQREAFEASSRR